MFLLIFFCLGKVLLKNPAHQTNFVSRFDTFSKRRKQRVSTEIALRTLQKRCFFRNCQKRESIRNLSFLKCSEYFRPEQETLNAHQNCLMSRVFHEMAFLVFRWLKFDEKKYAGLILAVESKSEEKSKLSLLEKKLAILAYNDISKNRKKIIKFNLTIKSQQT